MDEISQLYQELIIEHGTHPRNHREIADCTASAEGFNPLCGDKIKIFLKIVNGIIEDVSFKAEGCAISVASASIMSELLKGQSLDYTKQLFDQFHQLLTGDSDKSAQVELGKLQALAGVAKFPSRVKCATLAWHSMKDATNKIV